MRVDATAFGGFLPILSERLVDSREGWTARYRSPKKRHDCLCSAQGLCPIFNASWPGLVGREGWRCRSMKRTPHVAMLFKRGGLVARVFRRSCGCRCRRLFIVVFIDLTSGTCRNTYLVHRLDMCAKTGITCKQPSGQLPYTAIIAT